MSNICQHEKRIRKVIEFDPDTRKYVQEEGGFVPVFHQVDFCILCTQVVGQDTYPDLKFPDIKVSDFLKD